MKFNWAHKIIRAILPILVLVSLITLFIPQQLSASEPYVIVGDLVSISTTKGDIIVSPHTLTASGWVTVEFKSKSFTGDIDVVLGFNGIDQVETIKTDSWEVYPHTKYRNVEKVVTETLTPSKIINTKSEVLSKVTPQIGDKSLNPLAMTVTYEADDGFEGSQTITQTIAYKSFNGKTFTYDVVREVSEAYQVNELDWKSIETKETLNETWYSKNGANKWQEADYSQSVIKDTWYKARFWVEIPFAYKDNPISGKYNVLIKPSSLSVSQALSTGNCVLLDPWYNASWAYRKSFTITDNSDNYTTKLLIGKTSDAVGEDVDCGGNVRDDFNDLIFTGDSGTAAENMDYWIESIVDSGGTKLATVWVKNLTPSETSGFMYYGNAGAAAASNGAVTFIVFDDFEWGNDGDPLSDSGGSVTWTDSIAGSSLDDIDTAQHWGGIKSALLYRDGANNARALFNHPAAAGYAIRWRWRKENAARLALIHGDDTYQISMQYKETTKAIEYYDDGGFQGTGKTLNDETWGLLEVNDIDWDNATFDIYVDGVLAVDDADMRTDGVDDGKVRINNNAGTSSGWFDDIIIRKWATTEQTFGGWGAETVPSCALTGTVTAAINETDIVAGGKTIILTLTAASWVATVGDNNAITTALIAGIDSAQAEANGWDAVVKTDLDWTDVTRTSDTVVTIILPAEAGYDITAQETITATIPATALDCAQLVASPTFTIDPIVPVVQTNAATDKEDTTATLQGEVTNDNGETIDYYGFVWDKDADGGNPGNVDPSGPAAGWDWGWKSVVGDYGANPFSHAITGLPTGTTIHVRAAAHGDVNGWVYGADVPFLTKPAAPTNVAASDGTSTGNVTITWTKSTGATDYHVWRGGVDLGAAGDVATFDDIGADPPTITAGTATACDACSDTFVTLSVAGEVSNDGTTHTYKVVASNATGDSDDSLTDTGYRGHGALTYEWFRSAADADAGFASISGEGGTTDPYNDPNGVAFPDGRWYLCALSAVDAVSDNTTHDRGYMSIAPTVVTGLCTGFGETWAIANGSITALGSPANVTNIGFDYGLTGAYGSEVTLAGVYTTGTNYALIITGLNPATVYHYRFKANNGAWGYGADRTFATEGSASMYEYLTTGSDNCSQDIYGSNWEYQTFTTTEAHTVSSVWLYMQRFGTPGTITTSIRHESGGVPTGVDLGTSTYNGNSLSDNTTGATWCEFAFSPEITLTDNTTYAIVVRAIDGDASNTVQWCMVNAGGIDGNAGHSTNSGSSWISDAPADHLIQVWGYPCFDIEDVKVFTDYQTTGDWLVVVRYINIYPPYYDSYDIKSYFVLQLTDTTGVVKAQVSCPSWDYKPGSIYLSPLLTSVLTYGGDYRVRLYGTFTGNPYTEYAIQATDWLGSDMTRLDSWVITSAKLLADYYDEVMTTYIADRGEVLNSTGGVIFANGITALSSERPNLFQIISQIISPPVGDFPQVGEGATTWQSMLGPYITAKLANMGNVFGVDGKAFGSWILIGTMVCLMVFGLPTGHTAPANILAIPIFLMGLGLRLFDWATGAVMLCLMAFLLFYQIWFKYG